MYLAPPVLLDRGPLPLTRHKPLDRLPVDLPRVTAHFPPALIPQGGYTSRHALSYKIPEWSNVRTRSNGRAVWRLDPDDQLVALAWSAANVSWEALRWTARCIHIDCDQGSEAFASYEAVDEWSFRHRERRGHSVTVDCEWDCPDGNLVRCPGELAERMFRREK